MLGLASAAAGVFDVIWGEFEPAHQPIQALGDNIPGRDVLAYIAAAWLILGGLAIMSRHTVRAGAIALAVIYGIFGAFWLPRFYTAPYVLGFRAPVLIGVLGGMATQLIVVAAALLVFASTAARESSWLTAMRIAHWTFGLASVDFGLCHITGVSVNARLVPKWMPLGGDFWTIVTGIAFVMAGLAILTGILDVLAARLLALMLLTFSALALTPGIFANPHDHVAWGANAYTLAAAGATWIFACALKQYGLIVHRDDDVRGSRETPEALQ